MWLLRPFGSHNDIRGCFSLPYCSEVYRALALLLGAWASSTNLESAGVLAVEHADEELEPDGLAEAEAQHGDGVRDLLVAVGHVAQAVQQLQRQHAGLAVVI